MDDRINILKTKAKIVSPNEWVGNPDDELKEKHNKIVERHRRVLNTAETGEF